MPPSGPQGIVFIDGGFIEHLASVRRLDETGLLVYSRVMRTMGRKDLRWAKAGTKHEWRGGWDRKGDTRQKQRGTGKVGEEERSMRGHLKGRWRTLHPHAWH